MTDDTLAATARPLPWHRFPQPDRSEDDNSRAARVSYEDKLILGTGASIGPYAERGLTVSNSYMSARVFYPAYVGWLGVGAIVLLLLGVVLVAVWPSFAASILLFAGAIVFVVAGMLARRARIFATKSRVRKWRELYRLSRT